jgi:hypothetical protein
MISDLSPYWQVEKSVFQEVAATGLNPAFPDYNPSIEDIVKPDNIQVL